MINRNVARAVRTALFSAGAIGAGLQTAPVAAQEQLAEIIVTGSRIVRRDFTSDSPVTTFPAEQVVRNADVTLDTFLNTLPKVSPAGTTTSNNPGNGGQSNVDLGLGANRNLVLLDGRRAMPSASNLTVDINTIPQAMIESIEIVTGGASAVYGADAVAGAVNFKLKRDFEGVDVRYSFSNSTEEWDAQEWVVSAVMGGNFADGRGNAVFGFDYSDREGMIKSQREFAAIATSTTSFLPEGNYITTGNAPTQAAVDALFATYGVAAGAALPTTLGFNLDGTMYSRGIFNSPLDVQNFRYPIDGAVNQNLFPDLHSYNFDFVNLLVLPLERRSFLSKMNYEFEGGVEVFGRVGWTDYESATALAPTPFPTGSGIKAPGENSAVQAVSPFVTPGSTVTGAMIVPLTNPYISADMQQLLASRVGDNPALLGSGANEPFLIRQRSLDAGLRQSNYENNVVQYMVGAKGPIMGDNWSWELSYSEGYTEIDQVQTGNLDNNRLLALLAAADGGAALCGNPGTNRGFNILGRHPLEQGCIDYITVDGILSTEFDQQIAEGIITGDIVDLPAGPLSVAFGLQGRYFEYRLEPGTAAGPISGFNAQNPARGKNTFEDIFAEFLIPIVRDKTGAQAIDLNLGYRLSSYEFEDITAGLSSPTEESDAYFASFSWSVTDAVRFRGGFQRAVRAPNFSELFDGGGSAPQYFDPCSITGERRTGPDAAAMRQLCLDTGVGSVDNFVQAPGGQLSISVAGNTALVPEEADTYSFGVVFSSPWDGALANLQASLDYSSIEIDNAITSPAPNVIVASCYNYYGTNPNYDIADPNCAGLVRGGADILFLSSPFDPTGNGLYPTINGGKIAAEAIDLQVNYGVEIGPGDLNLNLLWSHNLKAETQETSDAPVLDYSGTVAFFGSGLGSSAPEDKANLSAVYTIGDFAFDARARWISSMDNRAAVIFPGENEFTGVPSVTYFDLGASWRMGFLGKDSQLRVGVNNVADKQPPVYAPNVQSGTEPSLYDVVGRRVFGQVIIKF